MTESGLIKSYKFDDIHNVPSKPGIYAWYGLIQIGPRDWKEDIDKYGIDIGEGNLRQLIARHTACHSAVPLKVNAKSNFDCDWNGELIDTGSKVFVDRISSDENYKKHPEFKLFDVIKDIEKRELLVTALKNIGIEFLAPIYIGKSKCLKDRLQVHKSSFQNLYSKRSYEDTADEPNDGDDFASRAISSGFKESNLKVYVCDLSQISPSNLSEDEIADLAESLEYLLNRWHKPHLGRR